MDALLLLARLLVAAVFLAAAAAKLLDLPGTRDTLRAFGVREAAVRPAGVALPALEGLATAGLLLAPTARLGGALALLLLAAFSGAVARLLRAGQAPACHCFGNLSSARIGRGTLLRNAALALPALLVIIGGAGMEAGLLGPALAVLAAAATLALGTLRTPGRVGSRAPRWTLPTADGGTTSLEAELRGGEPLLLVFLAPGCGPCAALLDDLPGWSGGPRVVVLSAGAAEAREGVRILLAADDGLAGRYGVTATPSGVLLGADGRIAAARAEGALEIERLARGGAPLPEQRFAAWGVPFAVRSDLPLADVLPTGSAPTEDEPTATWTLLRRGGGGGLYREQALAGRGEQPADAVEMLAAAIRLHVAEHAPAHTFVHAGVVAWRDRAIVVPGRSFTGKSTFVTALLRAGARYMSDEYAVFDADGLVHAYDKPIALRRGGGFVSFDHPVGEFSALTPQRGPVALGAVVRAPFAAGAAWEPVAVSVGTGCMILMDNTVGIRRAPQRTLATLKAATGGATALDGVRGEADAAARALLEHLDRVTASSLPATA